MAANVMENGDNDFTNNNFKVEYENNNADNFISDSANNYNQIQTNDEQQNENQYDHSNNNGNEENANGSYEPNNYNNDPNYDSQNNDSQNGNDNYQDDDVNQGNFENQNEQNGDENSQNDSQNQNDNSFSNGNNNNSNNNGNGNNNPMEPEQFRKVFIGGLSYKTDDETLKNYFAKYGELVDYVVMKDSQSGRSRGFGFVTYSCSTMVDELMKNRPHIIDGRQVEPKRATPREDSGKQEVQMTVKKLFIGGLRDNITEDDLKNYFGNYGNVVEAIVMKDKESSKSRGFGFVTFDDYDPVDKIILEKHHQINGVNVHTQKALPKDFDKGPNNNNNNNNNQNNRQPNFRNNNDNNFNSYNNNFNQGGGGGGGYNNNNNNGGNYQRFNKGQNNNNNYGMPRNQFQNNSSMNNTYGSYNQAPNKPKQMNQPDQMNQNNNMMMNRNNKMGGGGGPIRGGHGRFTNRSSGPYGQPNSGFNNGNNNNFNNNRVRIGGRGIGQRAPNQRDNNMNNNSNNNPN